MLGANKGPTGAQLPSCPAEHPQPPAGLGERSQGRHSSLQTAVLTPLPGQMTLLDAGSEPSLSSCLQPLCAAVVFLERKSTCVPLQGHTETPGLASGPAPTSSPKLWLHGYSLRNAADKAPAPDTGALGQMYPRAVVGSQGPGSHSRRFKPLARTPAPDCKRYRI